jgi:DNA-binding response OmpR family regulator
VEAGKEESIDVRELSVTMPTNPDKPLILLVDDDPMHVELTRQMLIRSGYAFDSSLEGESGKEKALQAGVALVILDLILPPTNGIEVLKGIREVSSVPVLVLSAKSDIKTRVQALKLGADDYLNKPFDKEELLARVEALLRRSQAKDSLLRIADLEMDLSARTVQRGGCSIELSPTEFRLLEHLVRNKNVIQKREHIIKKVWGLGFDPGTNIVSVYISYLRKAIDEGRTTKLITTIRGKGFMMKEEP